MITFVSITVHLPVYFQKPWLKVELLDQRIIHSRFGALFGRLFFIRSQSWDVKTQFHTEAIWACLFSEAMALLDETMNL